MFWFLNISRSVTATKKIERNLWSRFLRLTEHRDQTNRDNFAFTIRADGLSPPRSFNLSVCVFIFIFSFSFSLLWDEIVEMKATDVFFWAPL